MTAPDPDLHDLGAVVDQRHPVVERPCGHTYRGPLMKVADVEYHESWVARQLCDACGAPAAATVLDAALAAHDAGLCVIRSNANDPDLGRRKRPFGQWHRWQHDRPDRETVECWFRDGWPGMGLVCGAVSGGLEMLELEGRAVAAGYLDLLRAAASDAGIADVLDRIESGYMEQTPSGGIHWLYRPERVEGSVALAADRDGTRLIETRGEGGFTIVAPSTGAAHPTGRPYVLTRGGFPTIARISAEERDALFEVCRGFDAVPAEAPRRPPEAPAAPPRTTGTRSWMDAVVADYNARNTWPEVLDGVATYASSDRHGHLFTRVGSANEVGARVNSNDRLMWFSTSCPRGFEPYRGGKGATPTYDRFSAHVILAEGCNDHDARVRVARRLAPGRQAGSVRVDVGSTGAAGGEDSSDTSTGAPVLPDGFWGERPELDHIRRAARSRFISPDAVFGATLARAVSMTHHQLVIPAVVARTAGLDIYCAIVANPGAGKGAALDCARDLIPAPTRSAVHLAATVDDIALGGHVAPPTMAGEWIEAPVGSGEGIVACFFGAVVETDSDGNKVRRQAQTAWNAYFRIDEGEILERLGQRRDQTTMTVIRQMWSRETIGQRYSDREKDRQVCDYRVGLVMAVQPALARFLFDDAAGGTPQRFVFLSGHHPGIAHNSEQFPGPLRWQPPCRTGPMGVAGSVCAEIVADHIAQGRGQHVDELDAHGNLRRLKVAAALAVLACRADITDDDWRLAGVVSDVSAAVRDHARARIAADARQLAQADAQRAGRRREQELAAEDRVAESKTRQAVARIVAYLERHGGGPCPWRDIRDSLGSRMRAVAVDARSVAVAEGRIVEGADGWRVAGEGTR